MRSLTVSPDSVKLKRVFEIDHDMMVLTYTTTSVDQIKQIKFFWRERVSQYEFYSSNSKYRGYIILIKKASGATASNILCHDSDTMIFDLALPGGILINTAALYGPNGDDDQYWKDVKSILDTRTGDGKMILGDFNVTLNFARDTSNYLTDPHKKCRKVINQWLYNLEFVAAHLIHGKKLSTKLSEKGIITLEPQTLTNSHALTIYYFLPPS